MYCSHIAFELNQTLLDSKGLYNDEKNIICLPNHCGYQQDGSGKAASMCSVKKSLRKYMSYTLKKDAVFSLIMPSKILSNYSLSAMWTMKK